MLSIIVPVYNEETLIGRVLAPLPYGENLEVIVADGGSSDKTVELAQRYPVTLIRCVKNRAVQMNEGAKISKGDVLLFLHADCLIKNAALEEIARALNNGYTGGCLSQSIDSPHLVYRLIEKSGNIRAKLFKVFYGDQALFIRRATFFRLGGFDDVELFEDIIFSRKLKNEGKTIVLNEKIYTSCRRWQTQGVVKATLVNWLLTFGFWLGIAPNTLKRIYRDIR